MFQNFDPNQNYYSFNDKNTVPVVFIHGVGLDQQMWEPQIVALKKYSTIKKIGRIVSLNFENILKIDIDCSFDKEISIEKVHDMTSEIEQKELKRTIRLVARNLGAQHITGPEEYFEKFHSDLKLPPNVLGVAIDWIFMGVRIEVNNFGHKLRPRFGRG